MPAMSCGAARSASARPARRRSPAAASLIGNWRMVVGMPRPARRSRSIRRGAAVDPRLFQRVLEAIRRLRGGWRDEFMVRSSQAISDLTLVGGRLL